MYGCSSSVKMVKRGLFGFFILVALFACSNDNKHKGATDPEGQTVPLSLLKLQKATQPQDCSDLRAYVVDSLYERYTNVYPYYYCYADGGGPRVAGAEPFIRDGGLDVADAPAPRSEPSTNDGFEPAPPASNADASAGSVESGTAKGTDTNNQEEGVNEADIVKRDDNGRMYILNRDRLLIANVFPGDMPTEDFQIINTIPLDNFYARNLFLDKTANIAIVIGTAYNVGIPEPVNSGDALSIAPVPIQQPQTVIHFIDINQPATAEITRTLKMDGSYIDGRRIENRLHLVSSHYLDAPQALVNDAEFWELVHRYRQLAGQRCNIGIAQPDVIDVVSSEPAAGSAGVSTDDVVVRSTHTAGGTATSDQPLPPLEGNDLEAEIERLKQAIRAKIENVVTEDVVAGMLPKVYESNSSNRPLACGDVYHPQINLDANIKMVASMDTSGDNVDLAGVVNNAYMIYASLDHLYLIQNSGGWWWAADGIQRQQTAIYKFAIGQGAPQYKAAGSVVGWIRNSFNLSEHNGVLRVATTERNWNLQLVNDAWRTRNHLITLGENTTGTNTGGGELNMIGSVEPFAKNETIQSVRYMGDRGFVVTFERTDPLFTVDLTDPANPKIMGELVITGFSSYMHPLGDNHILALGRAGDEFGTTGSARLQIFDVTDMANPQPLDSKDISPNGISFSSAEHDHHAFTFYEERGLLSIPIRGGAYWFESRRQNFAGMLLYKIDVAAEEKIRFVGMVGHGDLVNQRYCDDNLSCEIAYKYYPDIVPNRSYILEQENIGGPNDLGAFRLYLYTLSNIGIKANEILINDATDPLPERNRIVYDQLVTPPPYPVPILEPRL